MPQQVETHVCPQKDIALSHTFMMFSLDVAALSIIVTCQNPTRTHPVTKLMTKV